MELNSVSVGKARYLVEILWIAMPRVLKIVAPKTLKSNLLEYRSFIQGSTAYVQQPAARRRQSLQCGCQLPYSINGVLDELWEWMGRPYIPNCLINNALIPFDNLVPPVPGGRSRCLCVPARSIQLLSTLVRSCGALTWPHHRAKFV